MFVLSEIVGFDLFSQADPSFDLDPDAAEAILEQAGRFAAEVLEPINGSGDREGCTWQGGVVTTPTGFKEAFERYRADGWPTLIAPVENGGQGLPRTIWLAVEEYAVAANLSFACYNVLSVGAATTLLASASEELKAAYLPKLVTGEWSGTMNLTEPHCGTDLGLIRTIGTRREDGTYSVSGTKIFITAGEHDLTENIVHLVLAKTTGGPDNVRGLSLFLVPKFLPDAAGNAGERNGVACGSIEHKMGLKGSATCVMNYDDATGFLVGEECNGLAAMFVMVNMARLHVGMQGLGLADAAYQHAVAYARERRQGRAPTGASNPEHKADRLIVHPDVRRMLLECRALIEGSRALCLWTIAQVDRGERGPDAQERAQARDFVSLLTPVVKGFVTDISYRCTTLSQQVFGGHGFINEIGAEQFVRDSRITKLYEGANGIQALDLAARKVAMRDGETMRAFLAMVREEANTGRATFPDLAQKLDRLAADAEKSTSWLSKHMTRDPNATAAGAYSYMELVGYLALGWLWLRMAVAAHRHLDAGEDVDYHRVKIATARFYFDRLVPEAMTLRERIEGGAGSIMALAEEDF
ncbi:acyl-CoA dehydrogenase C-terminal domain-containing protein [Novosphingobium sp. 9U]|uniref:acyl-CoA dehydrogenase C-terminal domain-containing protein n=1 Tax=Novosphingobium sp. 9U TaxID=2653158 RepID=UPI001F47B85F|nr:acyl-CoA dehydrogenase C-terminal domain-containing protein [Novosphingobium sp. 9U]